MQTINQTYEINAPVETVWRALVNPQIIAQWSGSPAVMSDQLGDFKLWGGDIHGKNIQVIPHERLVQEWYEKNWELPSQVTLSLSPMGEITRLELLHENIPDDAVEEISLGWDKYYIGPLQKFVENN